MVFICEPACARTLVIFDVTFLLLNQVLMTTISTRYFTNTWQGLFSTACVVTSWWAVGGPFLQGTVSYWLQTIWTLWFISLKLVMAWSLFKSEDWSLEVRELPYCSSFRVVFLCKTLLQGIMVVVFIIFDWIFVLMNTSTMIPCGRVS